MSTTLPASSPIWTRRIADELWSGPVTPLTYSLLAEPMAEHMVRRPLRVAGLGRLAALPVLCHHASHVYVNAALLAEVIRLIPGGLRSDGLLGLLPDAARVEIGGGSSWLSGGAQAVAIALRAWRHEPSWAPWQRAAAFDRECVAVRRELENQGTFAAKPSRVELDAALDRVRRRLGPYLDAVSWGMVFAYVFYHLLYELTRHWAPEHVTERAALTAGLPGIASLEAHHDLRALGLRLAPDANATALVADPGPAGQALRAFLTRHGHRLTGRDLTCPTWRESPAMVVELALASAGTTVPGARLDSAAAARRRATATATISRALGSGPVGMIRRAAFHLVLENAQLYYALRENMRYHADFFLARMRQLALARGADLAARGRLAAADDVFWLDLAELTGSDDGALPLSERVDERRRAAAYDQQHPPPETLDATAAAVSAAPSTRVLSGEIGAPGRCQGRARLIRDPADFERVAPGDVLVAVYTDPGWIAVLERAAGVVLETGGLLSHGAIVARELGIPALVGVSDATRSIGDGDALDLDATTGHVTVVAPAPA